MRVPATEVAIEEPNHSIRLASPFLALYRSRGRNIDNSDPHSSQQVSVGLTLNYLRHDMQHGYAGVEVDLCQFCSIL
jgi:hypothetical protein